MKQDITLVGEPFPRLKSVDIVMHGILKFSCLDGFEGVVDVNPLIKHNKWFRFLNSKEAFWTLKKEDYGHHIYWLNEDNIEVEIPAEELKKMCEEQSFLHLKMAV